MRDGPSATKTLEPDPRLGGSVALRFISKQAITSPALKRWLGGERTNTIAQIADFSVGEITIIDDNKDDDVGQHRGDIQTAKGSVGRPQGLRTVPGSTPLILHIHGGVYM